MQSPYVAMGRQLLRSATRQRSCSSQPLHRSISTARHELLEPSPFIRSLGPRPISAPSSTDFVIYPNFLDLEEQDVLIKLALWKLDRADSRKKRRRRRRAGDEAGDDESARAGGPPAHDQLQSIFESEAEYGFEEGHFDSVITQYRESILSTFPSPTLPSISPLYPSILSRIYSLLPQDPSSSFTQSLWDANVTPGSHLTANPDAPFIQPLRTTAHALHLSSQGCILPHIDNIEASGSVIIGVSLGAERIMRLERDCENDQDGWEVLLKSGSVYVQQDSIRYQYKHSISPYTDSKWDDKPLVPGQRISLMIRNAPPRVV